MSEEIKWPKTVAYFYPEMCLKGYVESGSRRCANGWIVKIFVGDATLPAGERLRKIIKDDSITAWNDSPRTTLTDISSALNQLTEELGYTEPIYSKG